MRKPNVDIGKGQKSNTIAFDVKTVSEDNQIDYDNTNLVNHIPFMDKEQPKDLN